MSGAAVSCLSGRKPNALIVMGVSGSGKTTVARLIAERLGYEMLEGDSLHPPENVEKMRRGEPLNDDDRAPWLERIGERLKLMGAEGRGVVATCSALKRAYRAKTARRAARSGFRLSEGRARRCSRSASARGITNTCRPRCCKASSRRSKSQGRTSPRYPSTPALSAEAEAEAAVEALGY